MTTLMCGFDDEELRKVNPDMGFLGGYFLGAICMFILMCMVGTCYGDSRYRDAICQEEMLHVAKTGADSLHILHDHDCPISLIDSSRR
jgi:hypothetical protein